MSKRRSVAEWHALIYQAVKDLPGCGAQRIADHAGVGVASFRKYAEELVKSGTLRVKIYDSEWSNGSYRYWIVEDAEKVLKEPLLIAMRRLKTLEEEFAQVHQNAQNDWDTRLAYERRMAMHYAYEELNDVLSMITDTVEGIAYQARKKTTVDALKKRLEDAK